MTEGSSSIIGLVDEMDRDFIIECLDGCLLSEDEMRDAPDAWRNLSDPFPAWHTEDEVRPYVVEAEVLQSETVENVDRR